MKLAPLPGSATWAHVDARDGYEVSFCSPGRLRGQTTALETGAAWGVAYNIEVDTGWHTRAVEASNLTNDGGGRIHLLRNADNLWFVDGVHRPDLDGCADVDFESSAVTNTLPIHRAHFTINTPMDVASAYVRAADLRIERLEQTYTLTRTTEHGFSFWYEAPRFDFACELTVDLAGLVVDYPGIAGRDA